ncbi:MAG: 50S ribosomal protein L11 methyltransferase [Kiritimatiellales bacterium]|nr:50S ribosomal protein L11 methyltransferase [Kiritimatiellales bacterium]
MKIIENIIVKTVHVRFFDWFYQKIIGLGNFIARESSRPIGRPALGVEDAVTSIFPDLIVLNGPFKGMRYPHARSVGSTLFPKLLGSYERELHPVINSFPSRGYTAIVDVGCAEGFYAIGLARMLPAAKVYAYDINPKGRDLCQQMAELNGVSDRVSVGTECSDRELLSLDLGGRGLIVSDCEGFEKELFSDSVIRQMERHDFLIEAHDLWDRSISPLLLERFKATHEMILIKSVCDSLKVDLYQYEELRNYDKATRYYLMEEIRPECMNWLYMKAVR